MSWLSGWKYRKSHVINPATGSGEDYQISITVNYADDTDDGDDVYLDGKCNADFGDVRFTASDGTSELDYWMEKKTDSSYAKFWVKISDDISSSATTIYVYYGNSGASYTDDYTDQEHGENTFIFFDTFDSWNSSNWGSQPGYASLSDGVVTISAINSGTGNFLVSEDSFLLGKLRFRSRESSALYYQYKSFDIGFGEDDLDPVIAKYEWTGSTYRTCTRYSASSTYQDTGVARTTTYHDWEIRWISSSLVRFYLNDVLKQTHTTNISPSAVPLFIRSHDADGTYSYNYVDWIFLAKVVETEPTHGTWGDEESELLWIEADFETGDISEFEDKLENSGTVTATNYVAYHSNYSCKCDVNADGNAYAEGYFDINSDVDVIHCRGYFRLNQLPETNKDYTLISFEDTNGPTTIGYIQLIDDGGTKKWRMKRTIMNDATVYSTSTLCIPTVGLWTCVEFAHGEGIAKLWVDGNEIMSYTNAVEKVIDRVHVGACSSDIDADDTLEIYVDRIVVTDHYIGPDLEINSLTIGEDTNFTNSSSLITRQELSDHLYKVGEPPQEFDWSGIQQYLRFYNPTTGIDAYMFCPSLSDGGDEPVLYWNRALAVRKDVIAGGRLDSMEGVASLLGGVGWGPDGYASNPFVWLVGNQHGYPSKDTLEVRISNWNAYTQENVWIWGTLASGNIAAHDGALLMSHGNEPTTNPKIILTDTTGGGSGASATLTVDNGVIVAVNVTASGSNYSFADMVVTDKDDEEPEGSGAKFVPIIENGAIQSIKVFDGGSGYVDSDKIAISNEPHDTLYLTKSDGSTLADMKLETLNCGLVAYTDGKTRLARMNDGVVAVQSLVGETWFAGTLDASNVFVDHINSLSGEGITIFDPKLYFGIDQDTNLYRSAANTLKTDDNFICSGLAATSLTINGVEVISSSRTLANVSAAASIITSGTFNPSLIPTITYGMASFADQNLNQSNDAIFNSVTGTSTTAALKAGSGQNMVAIVHDGSHGYVTALSGSLIIGSSTGSVSFNMSTTVYPYGANQGNIGTSTYYWGSGWFNYLRYKDLNSFDALDDLALVKNYKTKKIEQNGIETEVIDHESLPFLNAEKTDANAEPFFDSGKVNGFLLGCVKRLTEEVDMLKGRLEKENPKEGA